MDPMRGHQESHQIPGGLNSHTCWNRCPSDLPLIILGDFNARFGSIRSEAIASHQAETENGPGHAAHTFLLEHELWAPPTHDFAHEGPGHTWISPTGTTCRLDYICIPCRWKNFEVTSRVNTEIDIATCDHDHLPVSLHLRMTHAKSSAHAASKLQVDSRKFQDAVAVVKFKQGLAQLPEIPWWIGAGYHAEILTQQMQQLVQSCFPKTQTLPRQRYITDDTWTVIQLRKSLLKFAQKSFAFLDQLRKRLALGIWRNIKRPAYNAGFITSCRAVMSAVRRACWWALHQRQKLHQVARQRSRQDRIDATTVTVEQFLQASRGHDTRALYKALKPFLGQTQRRNANHLRPLPAVKLEDGTLAPSNEIADERWRSHFANPEHGIAVQSDQLQQIAALQAPRYFPGDLQFDLASLPQLGEVEQYIHKAKRHKAAGSDQLPSDIYKIDPQTSAKLLYPLLVKCALRCTEPLRWRGGLVVALPKSIVTSYHADKFRSIMLADFA